MNDTKSHVLAQQLLGARRSGFKLEKLADALLPRDRAEAYAVQDALVALGGEELGGWKVAAGQDDPVCSPIFASLFRKGGDNLDIERTMSHLVEAEVAVRLGADLPPRDKPYTRQEAGEAIAALLPALEMIGCRFKDRASMPPLVGIGDQQNNSAVVVGADAPNWRDVDYSRLAITLKVGAQVLEVSQGPSFNDILAALAWLANNRARAHGGLKAGQVIITGSRVNTAIGAPGDEVVAEFAGFGSVRTTLI